VAAQRNDVTLVRLLLAAGAHPDASLPGASSALFCAAQVGCAEVVALLLDAGASPHCVAWGAPFNFSPLALHARATLTPPLPPFPPAPTRT
jgi:ankyrin repeat protein